MDIELLVKLTSRAWSLNILAQMRAGVPGRQAPLLAATQASRTSFAASLDHLVRLGLLQKNPGHGHPLRPEFHLTPQGIAAADAAARIMKVLPDDDAAAALLRRSWVVPILALTDRPQRFSVLKSGLVKITDRALSTSLGKLEDHNWIRREINMSGRMAFPTYLAVNDGLSINRAIDLPSRPAV